MKTNLKELRKAAGWSNADDFAKHLGIPAKTYRNYEQGVRSMNLEVACDICNALGCTLNDIRNVDELKMQYMLLSLDDKTEVKPQEDSDEQRLLELYRAMDADYREALMKTAVAYAAMSEKDRSGDRVDVEWAGIALS